MKDIAALNKFGCGQNLKSLPRPPCFSVNHVGRPSRQVVFVRAPRPQEMTRTSANGRQ